MQKKMIPFSHIADVAIDKQKGDGKRFEIIMKDHFEEGEEGNGGGGRRRRKRRKRTRGRRGGTSFSRRTTCGRPRIGSKKSKSSAAGTLNGRR